MHGGRPKTKKTKGISHSQTSYQSASIAGAGANSASTAAPLAALVVMRYGKSSGCVEIDPTVRQKPGQKPKSAAPGAPFGWNSAGTPYIGTQYCIKMNQRSGLQFASLSTRNGDKQYYWKPLASLSKKVALSALETYGSPNNLLAGESDGITIGEVLPPDQLKAARDVFTRLVGTDVLAQFEAADDESSSGSPNEADDEPTPEVKAQVEKDDTAVKGEASNSKARASTSASSSNATGQQESLMVSKKRKARMELVDDLKVIDDAKKMRSADEPAPLAVD